MAKEVVGARHRREKLLARNDVETLNELFQPTFGQTEFLGRLSRVGGTAQRSEDAPPPELVYLIIEGELRLSRKSSAIHTDAILTKPLARQATHNPTDFRQFRQYFMAFLVRATSFFLSSHATYFPCLFSAILTTFNKSKAIVIGPTPPGTGVTHAS